MTPKQVKEIFDKLPSKRRKVLLGFLAGHSREKIMVDADVPSDAALTGHLKELYKNFRIDTGWNDADDRRSGTRKLPLLISLFARCMPELLSDRISEVPNGVEQKEAIAKSHRESVESDAGSIEERYFRATSNFDSLEPLERKSRIQVLEEIAIDSPRYHWKVMEFLAAFVRNAPPRKEEGGIRGDIQAALTVIGQRDTEKDPENQRLDLNKVNIAGANLREAQLQGVNFEHANLQGAILKKANLKEASFYNTNLQGAHLWKAYFQEANFMEANLQGAILSNATMQKAKLWGTKLQGASLTIANLEEADLYQADLNRANLRGANFMGAKLHEVNFAESNLQGTKLQGADLTNAKNLDSQEISSAYGDSRTILPEDVVRPAHWK